MPVQYALPKPTPGTSRAASPTETEILIDVSDTIADIDARITALDGATSGPSLLSPSVLPDGSTAANVAWGAGNKFAFRLPRVPVATAFRYGLFQVGASAGNVQFCVVQLSGAGLTGWSALVANSGTIACPAVGHVRLDLGAFTLQPDFDFAIGFWCDSGAFQTATQGSFLAAQTLRQTFYIGTDAVNPIAASGAHAGLTTFAMTLGIEGDV